MTFEGDRCSYGGPTSLRSGEPMAIELVNRAGVRVYFWMVGFEEGFDVVDSGMLAWPPGPLDPSPKGVETGRWVRVEPGSTDLLRWVPVRGDQQWVPYCNPEAGSADPGAGLMHVAPTVLTMQP